MGNQNQTPGTQGNTGQRTQPQDPKIDPERDDPNTVERRTSDEGQGRDQQAGGQKTGQQQAGGNRSGSKGGSGSEDQGDRDQTAGNRDTSRGASGQSGNRGGNP